MLEPEKKRKKKKKKKKRPESTALISLLVASAVNKGLIKNWANLNNNKNERQSSVMTITGGRKMKNKIYLSKASSKPSVLTSKSTIILE